MDELFKRKGQLEWTIQVAQAELQQVNAKLVEIHNSRNATSAPTVAKVEEILSKDVPQG